MDINTLKRRLEALRQKTVENGCTEDEAMTAAEKYAELLASYEITEDRSTFLGEGVIHETYDRSQPFHTVAADQCHHGLEELCAVKVWFTRRTETLLFGPPTVIRLLSILGRKHDVVFAAWLYQTIDVAIERATEEYKKSAAYRNSAHKATAPSSFQVGMAARINSRMLELARPRNEVKLTTGTEVIVLKNALINNALEKMGLNMQKMSGVQQHDDDDARRLGAKAGDKVGLNRPVATDQRQQISAA